MADTTAAAERDELLDRLRSVVRDASPAERAELLSALTRTLADTADPGDGLWTAERRSLSRVIDAINVHTRLMTEI